MELVGSDTGTKASRIACVIDASSSYFEISGETWVERARLCFPTIIVVAVLLKSKKSIDYRSTSTEQTTKLGISGPEPYESAREGPGHVPVASRQLQLCTLGVLKIPWGRSAHDPLGRARNSSDLQLVQG